MKLYRSVGESEFNALIKEQTIIGRYNCKKEGQNTSTEENVCCFFVDEVFWKDKEHRFLIVVDIPNEYLTFGIGNYYAGKSLAKDKIWSGRYGSEQYKIREAYSFSYSINDVKEIFLFNCFAGHFIEQIKPIFSKYGIILHWNSKVEPFANSVETFNKYGIWFQTIENIEDWQKSLQKDKIKYIKETKKKLLNLDMDCEQALKIRQLLRI